MSCLEGKCGFALNPSREANRSVLAFSEIAANQAVKREADSNLGQPMTAMLDHTHRPHGAWSENYRLAIKSAQAASIRKTPRCLASRQILGCRHLQPLRAAHLPPLQPNNMSRASGALLGLG